MSDSDSWPCSSLLDSDTGARGGMELCVEVVEGDAFPAAFKLKLGAAQRVLAGNDTGSAFDPVPTEEVA